MLPLLMLQCSIYGPAHLIRHPSKAPFREWLFSDKVPFLVPLDTQSGAHTIKDCRVWSKKKFTLISRDISQNILKYLKKLDFSFKRQHIAISKMVRHDFVSYLKPEKSLKQFSSIFKLL